jgi:hypothetical protein
MFIQFAQSRCEGVVKRCGYRQVARELNCIPQKNALKKAIAKARREKGIMRDPCTDRHRLIMQT